tara:strand:+ start:709 stop:963 length:255 start_codon:yes stop_codon:yes gene_type:complete
VKTLISALIHVPQKKSPLGTINAARSVDRSDQDSADGVHGINMANDGLDICDTHEGREARWVLLCVAYLFFHRPIMEGIASLFG